jgi:hypothetical protein
MVQKAYCNSSELASHEGNYVVEVWHNDKEEIEAKLDLIKQEPKQ